MFINLTPHTINVAVGDTILSFCSTGVSARVATSQVEDAPIGGIPTVRTVYGDILHLPDPEDGVVYIVSGMVLARLAGKGRNDVVAPDTGPTALRYTEGMQQGQIRAVTRFVRPD